MAFASCTRDDQLSLCTLHVHTGEVGFEAHVDYHPEGSTFPKNEASIKLPIAETEVIAQYSDPLAGLQPWCLPHVYSPWAESEHATRLVHVREANGPVGYGPSIQK